MSCNRCGRPTSRRKCRNCALAEQWADEFDGEYDDVDAGTGGDA